MQARQHSYPQIFMCMLDAMELENSIFFREVACARKKPCGKWSVIGGSKESHHTHYKPQYGDMGKKNKKKKTFKLKL